MIYRYFLGHDFVHEPGCEGFDGKGHIRIFSVHKDMTEYEKKKFEEDTNDYELTEFNYGENIIVERISPSPYEYSCCAGKWDLIFIRTTTKSFDEENLLEDEEFISFEEAIEKKFFD